jgi:hypothetical protein
VDEFAESIANLLKAGWSDADIVRAIRLATFSEDELKDVVAETVGIFQRAERAAFNRVMKRRRASHA